MIKLVLWVFAAHIGLCLGGNILILLPVPFRSHTLTFKPLFNELANKGHNVTMISPFDFPDDKNILHIQVSNKMDEHIDRYIHQLTTKSKWYYMLAFWELGHAAMEQVLQEDVIKQLRDSEQNFDLIISENQFLHEPLAGFGHKFSCPIINIYPISLEAWGTYLTGNSLPYSYVPTYKLTFSDKMSFFERLQNSIMYTFELLGTLYYYLPIQDSKMKAFFGSDMPPLLELLKNSPLTLIDSHYSIGYKRPYLPNVVECGGLSLKSGKPLSKEMEKIISSSEKGVVYFSLGGHYNTSELGKEKIDSLLKAFGKLQQTVFVKLADTNIENPYKNVILSKWFPQSSILGHPNCKVIVTHGGLHSLTEAAYYGIPVVGIPLFSDQRFNLRFIEEIGMGMQINKEDISESTIFNAVTQIINNPEYKERAMQRSRIVKDRPMDPLNTSVFWVEYVMNHGGAKHLHPVSLDLPFYQYYLIDIALFVIFVFIVSIYIMVRFVKLFISFFSFKHKVKKE